MAADEHLPPQLGVSPLPAVDPDDPGRWFLDTMGDDPRLWLLEQTGTHTCGAGQWDSPFPGAHEPHCGIEPVAPVDDLVAIASALWRRQQNERRLVVLGEVADRIVAGDPDPFGARVIGWDDLLP